MFIGESTQDSITPTSSAVYVKEEQAVTLSCFYQYTVSINNLQRLRRHMIQPLPHSSSLKFSQSATTPDSWLTSRHSRENLSQPCGTCKVSPQPPA
ncbi:hypothetical protein Q7C36_005183 [Tachysurus vachellii]|uniref:Uncharacterized protein n=1 Tax=Tachysurus vachellii TaxID=175792 RepID=A0AA88T4U1_TACVA|nr:hypothetical protein Q7C36_005183 [Tachysurus vachellii]